MPRDKPLPLRISILPDESLKDILFLEIFEVNSLERFISKRFEDCNCFSSKYDTNEDLSPDVLILSIFSINSQGNSKTIDFFSLFIEK